MHPETNLKCSLTIKKIPHWINEKRTVNVRQVDEEEAHGASQLGLTVFRETVYESKTSAKLSKKAKRKKNFEPNLKKFKKTYDDTDSDSDYVGEFSDSDEDEDDDDDNKNTSFNSKTAKRERLLNHEFISSDDDDETTDPDFYFRGHISDFNSKDTHKTPKKISAHKSSLNKDIVSPNCKSVGKKPARYLNCTNRLGKLKNYQEKEISNAMGKRKNGINYFLVPVVKKYESPFEMKRRHRTILEKARERYEKVVNNINEEKNLLELEIMSLKLTNHKLSPSPKKFYSSDENNDDKNFYHLCPFQYCSMLIYNPRTHLQEYHKMITDVKDVKLYVNAAKKIKYFKHSKRK